MKGSMFLIVGLALVVACSSSASRPESKEGAPPSTSPASPSPRVGESVATAVVPTSIYSELSGPSCSREKETGMVSSEHECPGVAGYQLLVTNVDDRQSVTVITPNKRQFDLGLSGICKGGFCSVGQKAEWRIVERSSTPIALIVRINCQSMEVPAKMISYLSVSKITANEVCVTDRLPPTHDANVRARTAADSSAGKPCRKSSQ
jgi:hypothetical protein